MNPMLLQKQLRDNANDLQDFCKELKQWGDEMKRKEEALKSEDSNKTSRKSKISKKTEPKETNKSTKKTKPRSYEDWEKFDVEAECKKIDCEEDSESVESDLTDEFDESVRDEALLEKEKGNKFVKKQQWDAAIDHYTKAIDLYAYDPIFYANRALCYLKKENYKKAEVDCTTALQLDKTYVKAYQRRAAAREALGQLSEAHSDLLKVFDYEPNNKESKQALAKLEKKLEIIEKPPVSKDVQKPISKFTLSRQQKKQAKPATVSKAKEENTDFDINKIKVIERKTKEEKVEVIERRAKTEDKSEIATNRIIDKNKSIYWPSGNDVILVKSITKQPHMRSKKPLKRIAITDSDRNVLVTKCELMQKNKNIKESSNKNENTSHTVELNLSVPRTSVQFYSTWKMIKDDSVSRFRYLSQIDPKELRNIFFESLSTEIFSDILETLAESFVKENQPVHDYLEGLTYVKRFSALSLFMSANDKNAVLKLIDFMKASRCSDEKIDNVKQKYGLQ